MQVDWDSQDGTQMFAPLCLYHKGTICSTSRTKLATSLLRMLHESHCIFLCVETAAIHILVFFAFGSKKKEYWLRGAGLCHTSLSALRVDGTAELQNHFRQFQGRRWRIEKEERI